jgi:hypothetical protein
MEISIYHAHEFYKTIKKRGKDLYLVFLRAMYPCKNLEDIATVRAEYIKA